MDRVAVFARAPRLGRVKTRLARDVGAKRALAVHRELAALTLRRLASGAARFATEVWVDGDGAEPAEVEEVEEWRRSFPIRRQPEGDLGGRMAAAFEDGVTALVGCDVPALDAAYVDAALAASRKADLVLGPVEDGGYCLIAMRAPHREVFADIPWGTSRVLAATRSAAADLTVLELATLWDVDDGADLARWRNA